MNEPAAENDKKFSKGKAALMGLGAAAIAGAGTLAVLKLHQGSSLIKKFTGKHLRPVFAYDKKIVDKSLIERAIVKGHGVKMVDVGDMKKAFNSKKDIYMGQRYAADDVPNVFHRKGAINAFGKNSASPVIGDKFLYANATKSVSPKSWAIGSAEANKIKKMKSAKDVLEHLKGKHKGQGFIYKPRVEDTALGSNTGAKQLIHDGVKPNNKFLKKFHKDPRKYFGQEKLNIDKEYRITAVGNKVVAITDRYGGGITSAITKKLKLGSGDGMGLIPYSKTLHPKLHAQGQKMLNAHRKGTGQKGLEILNMDMVSVDGGKRFKVIEPNVSPAGGQLDNPIISHMLKRDLTGVETNLFAGAKAGVAAAAAGGIAYAAVPKKDKTNE